MPFRIALSGLNAAQSDLNVTANNIANTQTNGFKGSRTEFADLFAVSLQGVSSNASGNGVRVAAVTQQFAQGNIEFTDSNLDLAVSGQGMFVLSDNGALAYTRAGAYQMNRDGYVVNSAGQRLQVFFGGVGGLETQFVRDFGAGGRCTGTGDGTLDQFQDLLLARRELGTFGGKMRKIGEDAHGGDSYGSSDKGRTEGCNRLPAVDLF
jgi:flagellar hook-basal body protein